jgi:transcriptional regulator with XRE-family HTH domain
MGTMIEPRDSEERKAMDATIGSRIRLRRIAHGFSQEKLADALGISYQQIQKYERGAHRVSASRLAQIARVLGVRVTYFMEPEENAGCDGEEGNGWLQSRESIELVRAYHRIGDHGLRRRVVDLIRSMGEAA